MLSMTHLQQSLASWRSLPRVAVHGLTSSGGVTPWVPFLPESIKTEPQQDEGHSFIYYDLPLLHQSASGHVTHVSIEGLLLVNVYVKQQRRRRE